MTALRDQVFSLIVAHEIISQDKPWNDTPADPGNWTGGEVGVGENLGTCWGVDSKSYAETLAALPDDIRPTMPATVRDLKREQAETIFDYRYFRRISGDALAPPLSLYVSDAAYNNGVGRAARWLQTAVGVAADGQIGPITLAAIERVVAARGGATVCAEFMAQRLAFMAALPTWRVFGLGWSRRLSMLPFEAMSLR